MDSGFVGVPFVFPPMAAVVRDDRDGEVIDCAIQSRKFIGDLNMSGEVIEPELPEESNPLREAAMELGGEGLVKALAALAETHVPGSGAFTDMFLGWLKGGYTAYRDAVVQNFLREYLIYLKRRVERVEAQTNTKADWEYLTRPEYAAELHSIIETVLRAREREKVKAALNFSVNIAVAGQAGDKALREFVGAFLRDSTGLDIVLLTALSTAGEIMSEAREEVNGEGLSALRDHLYGAVGANTSEAKGMVRGSVGRLHSLGLCDAVFNYGGELMPIQRTPLGDLVLKEISEQ